jgi:hypothetical protein
MRRAWLIGVLAAVVFGGVERLACLDGEFTLDEIWSSELARDGQLFLWHDNNHHLNTLWLSLLPTGIWWGWYRAPAVVAGLASIVFAARIGRRWGEAEAVVAAWLVATCPWLVVAGAEARGYALAVCFALLAFDALWSYLDTGARGALALFWLATIIGFLSHLTFYHCYAGLAVWSARRCARQRRSSADEVRRMVTIHGVPALFVAALYLVCIRGMGVGGGPLIPKDTMLARLIALGLGDPLEGTRLLMTVVAGVLLLAGLWLLWRAANDVWLFFLTTVVVSPGLFLLLRRDRFVYERYLLISFVFFLLLLAVVLGQLWRRRGTFRMVGLALLTFFLAGNAWIVSSVVQSGRGEFHEALAWVLENDPTTVVGVTSDHDFQVEKFVKFYAPYLAPDRQVVYLDKDTLPAGGTAWLLTFQFDYPLPPDELKRDAWGNTYELVKAFPVPNAWAWGWYVYKRRPAPTVLEPA